MSGFAGFRLNADKDADIIADLNKYKNATDRIKQAYRLAMAVEEKNFGKALLTHMRSTPPVEVEEKPQEPKTLVWNFPKEPSVKGVTPIDVTESSQDKTSLKAKILSNGF